MMKHQSLRCSLFISIGQHQICVLGLGPTLHILFSCHAALDEFRLSQVLQDQSLEYGENLSTISVVVSSVHIDISHMELDEYLNENDLLTYIKSEQAQLFPRLGKGIYFDFVTMQDKEKQKVNVFAVDKEQLCYWLFKEDTPINLDYLGVDKIVENAGCGVVGVEELTVVSEIILESDRRELPNGFLSKIKAVPQFYNFHQDLHRLPQLFWPLLYLVVKERWL